MKAMVINNSKSRVPRQFLHDWVNTIFKDLKKKKLLRKDFKKEITLVFLEEKEAKKLNHKYRKKNYATDILSFVDVDEESMGELVLCPEVIKRQAEENSLTQKQEMGYLVLHGILHLLGYEHEKGGKEADEMYRIQDMIFDQHLR